jgi:hypothetical protein
MRSPSNQHAAQFLTLLMFILLTPRVSVGTAFAQNTARERPRIGLFNFSGLEFNQVAASSMAT